MGDVLGAFRGVPCAEIRFRRGLWIICTKWLWVVDICVLGHSTILPVFLPVVDDRGEECICGGMGVIFSQLDSRDAEVMRMNDKLFLVWISVQTVFNLVYQVRTMFSVNSVCVDYKVYWLSQVLWESRQRCTDSGFEWDTHLLFCCLFQ